jgi:diguanylate cyclase (GGDEF)-like protein/PAS domain S-box-containing protein
MNRPVVYLVYFKNWPAQYGERTIMHLLDPDNYLVTIHAASSMLVGAAIAVLGVYVLIGERGSRIGVVFWGFSASIGIWLAAFGATYASLHEPQAFFWIKFAQIGVVFIPVTILALAFMIVQRTGEFRRIIWASVAVSTLFCLGVIFTDLHIRGVYHYFWGYYPQYGPLGAFFLLYFFGIMASILRLYWIEYRGSTNARRKKRLKGLLIAFSIGYLASADFLAAFGVPLYPFGYIPMIPFLFITGYVIMRHRLADITPELAAVQILETMQGAVIVVDLEGKIRVINRAAHIMLGYHNEDVRDRDLSTIIELPPGLKDHRRLRERNILDHEMSWEDKGGRRIDISVSVSPMTERDGLPVGIVYVAHDITRRKKAEQRLEQLALYDALTGLPNRTLFFDRMNLLLALAKRNQYVLALLYMDLDRFKTINDTLGHEVGDQLLQEAAKRMTSCTRKSDTVARMGGDEFLGICGRITAAGDASVVARKIIAALAEPFTIQGNACTIGVSIGISLYPMDGDELEMLVNKADTAMYRVKESGPGGYAYFSAP